MDEYIDECVANVERSIARAEDPVRERNERIAEYERSATVWERFPAFADDRERCMKIIERLKNGKGA